jgi:TRAP-type mannitol/chloroaromatic compound transport system permease small subunit
MHAPDRLIRIIDAINIKVGKTVSWFTFLLVLITIYDVLMRYVFKAGTIWIQEAEWHLFAANFMLAGGWTLLRDGHVRVDLFYAKFNPKTKALIDLLGTIVFLLPFCALIIWASMPFVIASWSMLEVSPDPGGLPALYLLKTVIPVTFFLIGIQGISQLIKNFYVLIKGETKS